MKIVDFRKKKVEHLQELYERQEKILGRYLKNPRFKRSYA